MPAQPCTRNATYGPADFGRYGCLALGCDGRFGHVDCLHFQNCKESISQRQVPVRPSAMARTSRSTCVTLALSKRLGPATAFRVSLESASLQSRRPAFGERGRRIGLTSRQVESGGYGPRPDL